MNPGLSPTWAASQGPCVTRPCLHPCQKRLSETVSISLRRENGTHSRFGPGTVQTTSLCLRRQDEQMPTVPYGCLHDHRGGQGAGRTLQAHGRVLPHRDGHVLQVPPTGGLTQGVHRKPHPPDRHPANTADENEAGCLSCEPELRPQTPQRVDILTALHPPRSCNSACCDLKTEPTFH